MIKSEEQLNKALDKIEQLESQQQQLKREVKQNKILEHAAEKIIEEIKKKL